MIDVSKQEFEASFKKHFGVYNNGNCTNNSRRLLLFYAVECGLKSLIMKKEKAFMFSKLSQEAKSCKHNLKALLKLLDQEENYRNLKAIRTSHKKEEVTCGHYNEFWRYGVGCSEEDLKNGTEDLIEQELVKIAKWIEANI